MKSPTIKKSIQFMGRTLNFIYPRKALCVKQPWATFIAAGAKKFEVRSWRTRYRGPLTIVASQKAAYRKKFMDTLSKETGRRFPNGVAIGTAILVDVRPAKKSDKMLAMTDVKAGDFVWVLKDARFVIHEFSVKGRLGIFEL
jgi:hypothetical protein